MRTLKTLLLLTFILFIASTYASEEHDCRHDEVKHDIQFLDVEEDLGTNKEDDNDERVLAGTTYSQMRIYPYYAPLSLSSPSAFTNYIQLELVPPVIDYFQSALKIKYPVVGKLSVASSVNSVCGLATPAILHAGVATDYFYFFDSEYNAASWVAESQFCYLATGTNRPLVAKTHFNRQLITIANGDPIVHERNTYLLMHEMIHTLGFSNAIFPYFIDANKKILNGHIKNVLLQGTVRTVIDVPVLTTRVKQFFGCSSIQGAYLENNGGTGTAGSHFERRHFVYETMTSGVINGRRMSQFSFAMLEASGWYAPNYDYTEPYYFGQGQGCTFLTGSCASSTFNFDEFCKGTFRGCTDEGRGGGTCSTDAKADGCRYIFPAASLDCENPAAATISRLPSLQVFGRNAGSKCFSGTLTPTTQTGGSTNWCFKYTCSGSGTSTVLNVQVGNRLLTCKKQSKMTITGYNGYIDCPDPLNFCNTVGKKYCPRGCMGRGTCVNNVCVCRKGYTGIDCGLFI